MVWINQGGATAFPSSVIASTERETSCCYPFEIFLSLYTLGACIGGYQEVPCAIVSPFFNLAIDPSGIVPQCCIHRRPIPVPSEDVY